MSSLNLKIEDDGTSVCGDYSDKKAFDILRRYLEPNSDLATDKAANLITDMLPSSGGDAFGGGEDAMFGDLVLEVAEQIPYHHLSQVKLVWLIQRLTWSEKLTKKTRSEGYSVVCCLGGLQEAAYSYRHTYLEDAPDLADQISKSINMQAFLARLTECHFFNDTLWAVWELRQALEDECTDDDVYSCHVSGAAMWIILAGQTLFVQTVQAPKEIGPEYQSCYNTGPLYTGPKLGLERWRFWQKGFDAVAERKGATDECKRLASKAAELMVVLGRTMTW